MISDENNSLFIFAVIAGIKVGLNCYAMLQPNGCLISSETKLKNSKVKKLSELKLDWIR